MKVAVGCIGFDAEARQYIVTGYGENGETETLRFEKPSAALRARRELAGDDEQEVFTPLDGPHGKRLRFRQSEVIVLSGDLDTRRLGKKAQVLIDQMIFDVYGCACDLEGCNCDAYLETGRRVSGAAAH
jgi:hypothetical protein